VWVLVFIYFFEGDPFTLKHSAYETMPECFWAREQLGKEQSGTSGYFPKGQQALCIQVEDNQ
jgi:hypothetical protein|tara:strand:+ start:4729 stop:4914 length:186 start_codon:yes stop_codon:yes gene_type:complete